MRNTWKACREETAKSLRGGKLGTLQVDAQCPSGAQCKMMSQACGTMWDRTQGQGFVKFTSKGCTRGDLHIFDTVLGRGHSTAAISTAVSQLFCSGFRYLCTLLPKQSCAKMGVGLCMYAASFTDWARSVGRSLGNVAEERQ